ncbi:MAG: hypothetical protein L6406_25365 [Desulfobacterales bacterium]|nr:hypothetical protein [Desulfobacterales bacterium]
MKMVLLFICLMGFTIPSVSKAGVEDLISREGLSSGGAAAFLKGVAKAKERARQERRQEEERALLIWESLLEQGWKPAPQDSCTYWFPGLGMGLSPPETQ